MPGAYPSERGDNGRTAGSLARTRPSITHTRPNQAANDRK